MGPLAGRVGTDGIPVARSGTQQLWFAEFLLMIFGELVDELGTGLDFFDLVDFVHFFGFHAFDNLQFAFLFDFGLILHSDFGQFRHIIVNAMIDLINGGDFLDLSGLSVLLQILNHGDGLLPGFGVSVNFESFVKVFGGRCKLLDLVLLFGQRLNLLAEFGELIFEFFLFEFLDLSDFGQFGVCYRHVRGVDFCLENTS